MTKLEELAKAYKRTRFTQLKMSDPIPFLRNADNDWVEAAWIDGFTHGFRAGRDLLIENITSEIGEAGLLTVGADPKFGEEDIKKDLDTFFRDRYNLPRRRD